MPEPAERQRTVIRAPRVEFDLSALALGSAGWLMYQWSWPALASLLAVEPASGTTSGVAAPAVPASHMLRWEFFHRLCESAGLPFTNFIEEWLGAPGAVWTTTMKDGKPTPYLYSLADPGHVDLPVWKLVVVAFWLLALWTIVVGAVSRVYAVRIARDESIGAADAVAFTTSNFFAFVKAPLFVAAAAALALVAAALAGAGSAVPVAGPFLEIVLHPLALVAGLLVVVLAVGGIFGLPMMQAAIATERNGFLDAVSRTFSYVFTRPVAYVASVGLVSVVAGAISKFGLAFVAVATRAMQFGAARVSPDATSALGAGAGFALSPNGVMGWPQLEHPETVAGTTMVGIYVAWAFTLLAWTLVNGFVVAYFVGGLADTYFMLRRDVDGIDDTEVYLEGEEASLGEPVAGEPTPPGAKP